MVVERDEVGSGAEWAMVVEWSSMGAEKIGAAEANGRRFRTNRGLLIVEEAKPE